MPTYQPNIPTGLVPLDQDYLNLQGNFQQLNIAYGVDHVPFNDTSGVPPGGITGMHKNIHMIPQAAPAAISGIGQLFDTTNNDGYSNDQSLFFLTGGNQNIKFTRNFMPVTTANGATFLPGGLVLQYGSSTAVASSSSTTITFPKPFITAVYSVNCTVVTSDNSTIRFSILNNATLTEFVTTQTSTSKFTNLYWMAIGI
jgi:hypothetical protein